jgi:ribonucleoside-diphosphate reductase alpha chain
MEDRGIHHAADAMKELYDMEDAPVATPAEPTTVRNGSC